VRDGQLPEHRKKIAQLADGYRAMESGAQAKSWHCWKAN
jgi:hypothetical protein